MLKILIINTVGLKFEGITNSIVSYLEAMDCSPMKIDLALVSQDFQPEMLEIIKRIGCNIQLLPLRKKNTLRYFLALWHLIKKNRYDIVHAHGNSATLAIEMWAAKLAWCKVRIAHSHNTCTNYPKLDKLLRPFFNMAYTQGFACGTEAGKWLFGNKHFRVIPNGKDISKFAYNPEIRIQFRTSLNLNDKIVIGHAGNFNYQKNHEFLIKIFKELAHDDERYVLYLMGDGVLRPQIEKMVKDYELEKQVVFTGSISNMAEMLQAMDIMVFPSRFEGFPLVVLEWQIACLPCVISDAITKESKLTDLVSYMSLKEGPAAWADKIRSIKVYDREEIKEKVLEQIGRAGFDIEENAKHLKEIYYDFVPGGLGDKILERAKQLIFISNEVANGGAGRVISVLANSLAGQGYRIAVYSYNNRYETYSMDTLVRQNFVQVSCKSKLLNKLYRIGQLRKAFKRNPGATIISFEYFVNMQTIIAGLGLKNKIIISERNDPAQQDGRKVIKYLRDILYRFADVLVCQTPEAKTYFPMAVQKKAIVIPNPVKEGLPDPFSGERKKEIVNFGRLEKQKNLLLLIEAFALLHKEYPEYRLSFYGEGSARNAIETYIAERRLQDCIVLHGSTPYIHEKILDCAMFVSSSDYEGLSNSMLEAMALGLPCVVTDCPCGGARMMITSYENGILVPVGDVQAIYNAMRYMIENPEEAAYMSYNATKVRRELAVDKIITEWERII